MKICLSCQKTIVDIDWKCPSCGWHPAEQEGVYLFAEHIAGPDEGYDPHWYDELAKLENGNFWFNARNRLICWIAKRHLPANAEYLEIGCGTGFVLQMLRKQFPGWKIQATEAHVEGLDFAKGRVDADVVFSQMDARTIPFRDEFDVIGAFDVIEHIKDDEKVLEEIHAALKSKGFFLFSVPQHMFLWSRYDEIGCHFRRYSLAELNSKLQKAGFRVVETTSFNSLLLPLMLLSRLGKRDSNKHVDVLEELRLSKAMNAMLSGVLWLEFALTRFGIRWPIGGSRIVLAQKI